MGDAQDDENDRQQESKLWILFFCLFLVLLAVTFYAVCHGACSFWNRYCLCQRGTCCCCCTMDMEAYRRERESLRRLRELRRLHRMEQVQLRHQQARAQAAALRSMQSSQSDRVASLEFLATFSQIPGPIPNTFSSSGRVLAPPELLHPEYHHHHHRAVAAANTGRTSEQSALARAYEQMNALGFILVPANMPLRRREVPHTSSIQYRENYTPEQQRAILERLLVCKTYHAKEDQNDLSATQLPPSDISVENVVNGEDRNKEEEAAAAVVESSTVEAGAAADDQIAAAVAPVTAPRSFAFPLHEVPEVLEKTCAICLEDFEEGESINDASKCAHVFHKDCLLSWLDQHDVCPCCRCAMINQDEWQVAAAAFTNNNNNTLSEQQHNDEAPSASEHPIGAV